MNRLLITFSLLACLCSSMIIGGQAIRPTESGDARIQTVRVDETDPDEEGEYGLTTKLIFPKKTSAIADEADLENYINSYYR